jgi:hypothetical protein
MARKYGLRFGPPPPILTFPLMGGKGHLLWIPPLPLWISSPLEGED